MSTLSPFPSPPTQPEVPPPSAPSSVPPETGPARLTRSRRIGVVAGLVGLLVVTGLLIVLATNGGGRRSEAADLVDEAANALAEGRVEDAIADATAAIELDPADENVLARAYGIRSSARSNEGAFPEAVRDATRAIELEPTDQNVLASAFIARSEAQRGLRRFDESISDATSAVDLDDLDADVRAYVLASRSWTLAVAGDPEAAADDARAALEVGEDPLTLAIAHVALAQAYAQQGRFADQVREAESAIGFATNRGDVVATAYLTRSAGRYAEGRLDDAIDDATRAIEAEPTNPDLLSRSYLLRSLFYIEQAEWEHVIADATAAIDFDPVDPMVASGALVARGRALGETGSLSEATADFQRAVEVNPYARGEVEQIARTYDIELSPASHTMPDSNETDLLTSLLAPIEGYEYEDVLAVEIASDQAWLDDIEAQVDADLFLGFALHSVVADDPVLNTASGSELAFLRLYEFAPTVPIEFRMQFVQQLVAGDRVDRLDLVGNEVLVYEDPDSPDSRYYFTWLDEGVAGVIDGADRDALEAWLTLYLTGLNAVD